MAPHFHASDRAAQLLALIHGNWTTQAVAAAAELGLADALEVSAMSTGALGEQLGCATDSLRRLLCALGTLGLCVEGEDGLWSLEPAGRLLAAGNPHSLRAWAIYFARDMSVPFSELASSVRDGLGSHARRGIEDRFRLLEQDGPAAARFHAAITAITRVAAPAVAQELDDLLAKARRVVDVGGGNGDLLVHLLERRQDLEGVIADLPHAERSARSRFSEVGLQGRAHFEACDFFRSVPAGDLLVLKSVLHDWNDLDAVAILERCVAALAPSGCVVVVERLMAEHPTTCAEDAATARADLTMLVGPGGRERTLGSYIDLATQAGLELHEARATNSAFSCIVFQRCPRTRGMVAEA